MIDNIIGDRCSGCETCSYVCPRNCITMKNNEEGFRFPHVNESQCVKCGECIKKCPVINFENNHKSICDKKKAYAFKSKNDIFRNICSSGGVFMELAQEFIDNGATIYGAAFDQEYVLHHMRVDDSKGLSKLAGSKYVQSRIDGIYRDVKADLENQKKVLFVGLTCQVEGLKAFLGKNYEKLYCVDLICMGVPSPMAWEKYIHSCFNINDITKINFKDKRLGWHRFSVVITQSNGDETVTPGFDNKYMECMFKGYSIRKSCFSCIYKCENKIADLTIADCWGCENYVKEMDDNQGLSMIIVHSEKGSALVGRLTKKGELKEFDYSNVIKYNSNYSKCVEKRKGRKMFYTLLSVCPRLAYAVMGTNPNKTFTKRIGELIRRIRGR